jgi:hypothetical protein
VRALALGCALCLFLSFLLTFVVGSWSVTVLQNNETPGMSYHALPARTEAVAVVVRAWILVVRWASLWPAVLFAAPAALAQVWQRPAGQFART